MIESMGRKWLYRCDKCRMSRLMSTRAKAEDLEYAHEEEFGCEPEAP